MGARFAAAEKCPHLVQLEPDRGFAYVLINGGGGDFASCPRCKIMFESLIARFRARSIGPREVVDTMRANGYSRADAAKFVLQLLAVRLRVRLGFAVPE